MWSCLENHTVYPYIYFTSIILLCRAQLVRVALTLDRCAYNNNMNMNTYPTTPFPTLPHPTYLPTYLPTRTPTDCIQSCAHVWLFIIVYLYLIIYYIPIICHVRMCARYFLVWVYYLPISENSYSYGFS